MKWISVKDELPQHGEGSFVAYWQNRENLTLMCFVDAHSNYVLAGSGGDTCGYGNSPKFSHWMRLPKPPCGEDATRNDNEVPEGLPDESPSDPVDKSIRVITENTGPSAYYYCGNDGVAREWTGFDGRFDEFDI